MRAIKTTVGPLAAASANNICLSQTPNAGTGLVLNGTLATSLQSGTGSIAGNLATIAGGPDIGQVISGSQVIPTPITGIGITAGTYVIYAGQTVSSTTLYSNAVATLDTPRQILITTAGNESANTFTVLGTNNSNDTVSEVITGANIGTTASVLSYKTVASIIAKNTAAAAVTVGTNGVASSPWVHLDEWALPQTGIQIDVTGTVNYTVQTSMDSANSPTSPITPSLMNWLSSGDPNVVGATANAASSFAYSPLYARVVLNSGTGSVTMALTQYGAVVR